MDLKHIKVAKGPFCVVDDFELCSGGVHWSTMSSMYVTSACAIHATHSAVKRGVFNPQPQPPQTQTGNIPKTSKMICSGMFTKPHFGYLVLTMARSQICWRSTSTSTSTGNSLRMQKLWLEHGGNEVVRRLLSRGIRLYWTNSMHV